MQERSEAGKNFVFVVARRAWGARLRWRCPRGASIQYAPQPFALDPVDAARGSVVRSFFLPDDSLPIGGLR